MTARPEWMNKAACRGIATSLFYAESAGESAADAKRLCIKCPVRDDCLAHALQNVERFGIWGGLTPHERRPLRRRTTRVCICAQCEGEFVQPVARSRRYCGPDCVTKARALANKLNKQKYMEKYHAQRRQKKVS